MSSHLRCAVITLFVLMMSALPALADNVLTVHLGGSCTYDYASCDFDTGAISGPASGWAVVDNTPWSYNFETEFPTNWNDNEDYYSASFGPGGSFQMTGPDNLTFTGKITGGTSQVFWFTGREGLDMHFDGYWSNSKYAYGEVKMSADPDFGLNFILDVYTTPEPTSLVLLGSGIAGAFGVWRRRLRF